MKNVIAANDEQRTYISQLENKVTALEKSLEHKIIQFEKMEKENSFLHEQLKLALYRQYGKAAEKFSGVGQILLFDGGETRAPLRQPVETETIKSYTRVKRGRKPLDENIPREQVIIDIGEEEKHCACGSDLVCIGEDVVERLVMIPEQVYVVQYHVKKYACHTCEGSGDEEHKAVRTGKVPPAIMPGSIATPELLSYIFTKKYCDYMPYYRQEAGFGRIGVDISRQNMSNWQIKTSEKLQPLLRLILEHIRSGNVVQMDETPMLVMDEPGRENRQKSYMWLARGGPPGKPALWYTYRETHQKEHIVAILSGFNGYLQSDGNSSYESVAKNDLEGIIHVGCLAHVRRRFYEAMKISSGNGLADAALSQIKEIYKKEAELREALKSGKITTEEFTVRRREACEPKLQAFHEWLQANRNAVPPSSKIGDAISYALGEWHTIQKYLDDWQLTPDNNACERGIRPFVMGRKNWVMSGSPSGAQSSCEFYTLIETAKANNWNPTKYLTKVFQKAAEMKSTDDWASLLPWNLTP
jgi:transposase